MKPLLIKIPYCNRLGMLTIYPSKDLSKMLWDLQDKRFRK